MHFKAPTMPPASTPATAARWGRGLRLFFFFPRAVSSAPEAPAQGIFFVATSSKTYGRKRQKPRESERTGESSVVEMSHPPVGAACRTAFRSLACVGAGVVLLLVRQQEQGTREPCSLRRTTRPLYYLA